MRLKAHVASKLRPFVSRNVLAMLPVRTPCLAKKPCCTPRTTTLGIDPNLAGDKIYNGANDNATGCAIFAGARARLGWNAFGAAAVHSIRIRDRRRAGLAGFRASRKAFTCCAGKNIR